MSMKTNTKQKRNWAAVILALTLSLGAVACGKGPETAGSTAPAASASSVAVQSAAEQTAAVTAAETSAVAATVESQATTSAAATVAENPTGAESTKASEAAEPNAAASGEKGTEWALIALDDKELNLEKMLSYALLDEYHARDSYVRIMSEYGEIRPFSNIKSAEETHIELLLPLFQTHAAALPDYTPDQSAFNGTLEEAYKAGVAAEIANIQMYEYFMSEELPDDVRTVFESLMQASKKTPERF